jgi:hypothetical protein
MAYTYLILDGDQPVKAFHRKYELTYFVRHLPEDLRSTYVLWRIGGRQGPVKITPESLGL